LKARDAGWKEKCWPGNLKDRTAGRRNLMLVLFFDTSFFFSAHLPSMLLPNKAQALGSFIPDPCPRIKMIHKPRSKI